MNYYACVNRLIKAVNHALFFWAPKYTCAICMAKVSLIFEFHHNWLNFSMGGIIVFKTCREGRKVYKFLLGL